MKDIYNAKQAGIQGANAGQNATVYQKYNEGISIETNYDAIIDEISIIKKHLKGTNDNDDTNDILIGELTKISHAAKEKDDNKMVNILKTCAKEVYDIAKKVGCSVLAKFISYNTSLQLFGKIKIQTRVLYCIIKVFNKNYTKRDEFVSTAYYT